jgi:hypothetical protein
MTNDIKEKLKGNEKMYLGFIFILLGCSNIIGLLSLNNIVVFCFTLGSFSFALSDFFKKFKGAFLFFGLLCIVGLPLISNPQIILKIRTFLSEETILLITLGFGFLNLYLSEPKKKNIANMLKKEYEKGKAETLDKFEEILNKKIEGR